MSDKIIDKYSFKINNINVIWTNDLFPFTEKYFKKLIKELILLYPDFFKYVKNIDLTDLTKTNNIFYIDGNKSQYIREGLFVNNLLVKNTTEEKNFTPIKLKRTLNRSSLKHEEQVVIKSFKFKNKNILWTDLHLNKEIIKEIILKISENYKEWFKTIKQFDFTKTTNINFNFYADNYPCYVIADNEGMKLFYKNILVKNIEENEEVKIIKSKVTLRKNNRNLNLGLIDYTETFKHEKPYMWSVFKDLNPKVYNFRNENFYLFFNLGYRDINEEEYIKKFEDMLSKLNYKIKSSEYKNNSVLLFLCKED